MMIIVIIGLLLFIIPGIIAAIGLSQTYFILADEPKLGGVDALKKSWDLMDGNKVDYFILGLRFIPWALLCLLTFGIGFLFLGPYVYVTFSKFYDAVRYDGMKEDDVTDHLVDFD